MEVIDRYIADRRDSAVEAWLAWNAVRRALRDPEQGSVTRIVREERAVRHYAAYRLLRDDVAMLRHIRKAEYGSER